MIAIPDWVGLYRCNALDDGNATDNLVYICWPKRRFQRQYVSLCLKFQLLQKIQLLVSPKTYSLNNSMIQCALNMLFGYLCIRNVILKCLT